ncbi:hypothetical protein BKA93DRAFT_398696 [Sparassis latifolia]
MSTPHRLRIYALTAHRVHRDCAQLNSSRLLRRAPSPRIPFKPCIVCRQLSIQSARHTHRQYSPQCESHLPPPATQAIEQTGLHPATTCSRCTMSHVPCCLLPFNADPEKPPSSWIAPRTPMALPVTDPRPSSGQHYSSHVSVRPSEVMPLPTMSLTFSKPNPSPSNGRPSVPLHFGNSCALARSCCCRLSMCLAVSVPCPSSLYHRCISGTRGVSH